MGPSTHRAVSGAIGKGQQHTRDVFLYFLRGFQWQLAPFSGTFLSVGPIHGAAAAASRCSMALPPPSFVSAAEAGNLAGGGDAGSPCIKNRSGISAGTVRPGTMSAAHAPGNPRGPEGTAAVQQRNEIHRQ